MGEFMEPIPGSLFDEDLKVGLWPVLNYPKGHAFVGVKLVIRKAKPLTDSEAVRRFHLGRFGGEETIAGQEKLQKFAAKRASTLDPSRLSQSMGSNSSAGDIRRTSIMGSRI